MRVMIVDDDDDVRAFLEATVAMIGATTIKSVASGEEALAAAVQGQYDLVTLDIKMPGVSGIDIISVIRGMMPTSVIAIVSGYAEEVSDEALEHADLVLGKPVRVDLLKRLIGLTQDLVERRELIRGLADDDSMGQAEGA